MLRWIQITSGRGPEECCFVVANIIKQISREADQIKIEIALIDSVSGDNPNTLKSALMAIEGDKLKVLQFADSWEGTIQMRHCLFILIAYCAFLSPPNEWNLFPGLSINPSRLGAA